MKLASEMKNLSEDIVASFKQRIKENEELVAEVQKTLDGFRKDHQEMANVLKSNAASLRGKMSTDEKNRMNNYNELMTGIQNAISLMQNEISKMLSDFTNERKQMADELNIFFAKNRADRTQDEKNRLAEFNILMKSIADLMISISNEVSGIFKYTNDMIAKFDKEHKEMSVELRTKLAADVAERVAYTKSMLKEFQKWLSELTKENQKLAQKLRKDIANGDAKRLKDYNDMMKGIQSDVKNLKKAIASMLGDFSQDRGQAAASWKKMSDIISQLRKKGFVAPVKSEIKKIEKIEVKKEIPVVAPAVEEPIVEKKKIIPETAIELTLDEKVENFINSRPDGVRVIDMEEPFGETRMKLGYVAKKLLDEGKVQKQDNLYFPKIRRDKKFNK